jgi:hypothetical protein
LVISVLLAVDLTQITAAQVSTDSGLLCVAVTEIQALEASVAILIAPLAPGVASAVIADLLNVLSQLLADVRTLTCGGSSRSESSEPTAAIGVGTSNAQALQLHLAFPGPVFQTKSGGGSSFVEMTDPGVPESLAIGEPEVPTASVQFAVPVGANFSVQVTGTSGYEMPDVNLWPAQPDDVAATATPPGGGAALPLPPAGDVPTEPTPLNPPFTQDTSTYASSDQSPSSLITPSSITLQRSLHTASVVVSGAQFTPALHELHVVTGVDLTVTFGGANTGSFGTSAITNVWNDDELPVYESEFANWNAVLTHLTPALTPPELCGEQLLIVTAPVSEAAADSLAAARNADGVLTRVAILGEDGIAALTNDGITNAPAAAASIRSYIAGQFDSTTCEVHPSYVLLIGDTDTVPTWEIPFGSTFLADSATIASDRPHGMIHQAAQIDHGAFSDLSMDLAVSRIPGDGNYAVSAVDKIIAYEDDPPTQASFYQDATSAAYFQSCPDQGCDAGSKTKKVETPGTTEVHPFLYGAQQEINTLSFAGKTVDRQWIDTPSNSKDSFGGDDPQKFSDGESIPSGVSYTATGAGINADINAGRFLVVQNDHGFDDGDGWAHPNYELGHGANKLGSLTNTNLYPVFWSLDCDAGDFDRHVASDFTQWVVDEYNSTGTGGAGGVGSVASSQQSFITRDATLGADLASTVFPQMNNAASVALVESLGFAASGALTFPSVSRLGDTTDVALNALTAQTNLATDIHAQGTDFEYNTFGDPTMYMWTAPPKHFNTTKSAAALVDPTDVRVTLPGQSDADGANVTLVQDGRYLGRAVLSGGSATIPSVESLTQGNENDLQVIFEKGGYVSATYSLPTLGAAAVDALSPSVGPTTGGTPVTIEGDGFNGTTSVNFGSTSVPFAIVNNQTITATAPAGVATTHVTVVNPTGTSAQSSANQWGWLSIISAIQPSTGFSGDTVNIKGTGFVGVTAVEFGTTPATSFSVTDTGDVSAVVPPGTGSVAVTVTTTAGPSLAATTGSNTFSYLLH